MNTKRLIKQTLIVFALMVGALTLLSALPGTALAALDPAGSKPDIAVGGGFRGVALTIINYFLGFLGLIAVVMVIYGGVTYVVSAGNDEAIGNAKKIIMYALIGIIIILLSFALVNTVLSAGEAVEPT
jgi:heme/copper-type cytochrome/quinol oxidase subunit 2